MTDEITGLTGFPSTKTVIKMYAENAINDILWGNVNPLEVKVKLSAMKSIIEEIEKSDEYRDAVLKEAEKYHKEELKDLFNSFIQVKETGVKYDYLSCNYPKYTRIQSKIDELTTERKSIETYLKTITKETEYIDPETGEMVIIIPPSKTSTTSVTITINK